MTMGNIHILSFIMNPLCHYLNVQILLPTIGGQPNKDKAPNTDTTKPYSIINYCVTIEAQLRI